MNNTQTHKSLQLLRDGFMTELTEKIYSDERFTELMMKLTQEFVEENIPIVDEDLKLDLAFMMMEQVKVSSYWWYNIVTHLERALST